MAQISIAKKAAIIKNAVLHTNFTIETALVCVEVEDYNINDKLVNEVLNESMNYFDFNQSNSRESILKRSLQVRMNAVRWPDIKKTVVCTT